MLSIVPDLKDRLFEFVNLGIDGLETLVVGGSEILTACHLGDVAQERLIDLDLHILHLHAEWRLYGDLGSADGSDANGVDTDAESLRELGSLFWRYGSAVVHAVGEQDYDLALGFALLDSADSRGETHADCRTIFKHACTHILEEIYEDGVVGGEGALSETLASEYHETDVVIRTPRDKLGGNILCSFETIWLEIDGSHGARDVEREDDVDTLGIAVAVIGRRLRTCEDYDSQGYCQEAQSQG